MNYLMELTGSWWFWIGYAGLIVLVLAFFRGADDHDDND